MMLNIKRVWVSQLTSLSFPHLGYENWKEREGADVVMGPQLVPKSALPFLSWTGHLSTCSLGALTLGAHIGSFSLEMQTP